MEKLNAVIAQERSTLEAIKAFTCTGLEEAKQLVAVELAYLQAQAVYKPEINDCLPITIGTSLRYVIKNNLSLDPQAGLIYLTTRNLPGGQKALEIEPTANGRISIARMTGGILDFKRPEVRKDAAGKVIAVTFEVMVPGAGTPRWEKFEFDESDFMRWKKASHKQNGRNKPDADLAKMNYANINYSNFNGGIDPEFARAKAIKHGLKKLGTNINEGVRGVSPISPVVDAAVANEEAAEDAGYAHEVAEEQAATPAAPAAENKGNQININTLDL